MSVSDYKELKDPLYQAEGQTGQGYPLPPQQQQQPQIVNHIPPDVTIDSETVGLVQGLPFKHKSGIACQAIVHQNQIDLVNECQFAMSVMKDRLTIHELVATLLNPDEKLLNEGKALDFSFMTWTPLGVTEPTHKRRLGQLIITNQRLLCVSSTFMKTMTVSQVGDPKTMKPPGFGGSYYQIDHNCSDWMWFFPIPIQNFQHFSLLATAGTQATRAIDPIEPGCFGWCPCLCMKQWRSRVLSPREDVNKRTITLSGYFPPWNEKYTFEIFIKPDFPLSSVGSWMAAFNSAVRAAQNAQQQQQQMK